MEQDLCFEISAQSISSSENWDETNRWPIHHCWSKAAICQLLDLFFRKSGQWALEREKCVSPLIPHLTNTNLWNAIQIPQKKICLAKQPSLITRGVKPTLCLQEPHFYGWLWSNPYLLYQIWVRPKMLNSIGSAQYHPSTWAVSIFRHTMTHPYHFQTHS